MDWDTLKEVTAFAAVIASFLAGLFVGIPRAFKYHETRLHELSDEYRKREEEQEARHRKETREMLVELRESEAKAREEDNRRFCVALSVALAEITNQLKQLENRLDEAKIVKKQH